jgi:hypothetical protein
MGLLFISRTQILIGNKVENMHAIKFRLLYSFIIVVWWLYDKYWLRCKYFNLLVICSCWFMSMPLRFIELDVWMIVQFCCSFFVDVEYMIFVQCLAFASSIFFNYNIDIIIGFGISFSNIVFNTCVFIIVYL